jgi:alpha-beta hydrolase superfamily lysophospholipase
MVPMAGVSRRAGLIETAVGPVHAIVHLDADATAGDTVVLLLPPFGWDDVCSYRPRRDWADALAGAGHLAARITYPSAGDSGGTVDDPDRLDAWADAVTAAAARLRADSGRPRLAVIGIELGGLIACHAIARELAVDDLVLWGAPARGRQFVRRVQAFANLEATTEDRAPEDGEARDGISAGGFRLSAQTLAALSAFDAGAIDDLGARAGRVMLLGLDQVAPDSRLRDHLTATGGQVTVGVGNGYSAMTAPSFEATTPQATIDAVGAWLDATARPLDAGVRVPEAPDPGPVEVPWAGELVRETQLALAGPHGELSGVLAEPPAGRAPGDVCVLLLDTGTIRRIGPNRLWVEAARRWAVRGLRSVRFDMDGMGDSDGDPEPYRDLSKLYDPWIIDQVTTVMDQLCARGLAERFAIVGLSAGAYWALHAALGDDRVVAVALMNPGALVWDPGSSPLGDFRTMRTIAHTRTISRATLRKAFGPRGLALALWLVRAAGRRALRRGRAQPVLVGRADEMRAAVASIETMPARRLLVFCDDEPSLLEITELGLLEGLRTTPGVEVVRIASGDHTVRPLWAQRELHAAVDRWLEAVTAGAAAAEPGRGDEIGVSEPFRAP